MVCVWSCGVCVGAAAVSCCFMGRHFQHCFMCWSSCAYASLHLFQSVPVNVHCTQRAKFHECMLLFGCLAALVCIHVARNNIRKRQHTIWALVDLSRVLLSPPSDPLTILPSLPPKHQRSLRPCIKIISVVNQS